MIGSASVNAVWGLTVEISIQLRQIALTQDPSMSPHVSHKGGDVTHSRTGVANAPTLGSAAISHVIARIWRIKEKCRDNVCGDDNRK
jgi:hypothetical protein